MSSFLKILIRLLSARFFTLLLSSSHRHWAQEGYRKVKDGSLLPPSLKKISKNPIKPVFLSHGPKVIHFTKFYIYLICWLCCMPPKCWIPIHLLHLESQNGFLHLNNSDTISKLFLYQPDPS